MSSGGCCEPVKIRSQVSQVAFQGVVIATSIQLVAAAFEKALAIADGGGSSVWRSVPRFVEVADVHSETVLGDRFDLIGEQRSLDGERFERFAASRVGGVSSFGEE